MIIVEKGARYKPRSMYPCQVLALDGSGVLPLDDDASAYGYLSAGTLALEGMTVRAGQYFCLTRIGADACAEFSRASGVAVIRHGFKGLNQVGGPLEASGRLVYIDGCSDTLLVSPPRLGDSSLNHLHFPPGVDQSFHIHPSIRAGMVVSGAGRASLSGGVELPLRAGAVFVLDERERHRFCTDDSEMHIVAFHPDGDFGPTDENHPMKNRTLISKA